MTKKASITLCWATQFLKEKNQKGVRNFTVFINSMAVTSEKTQGV